MPKTIKNSFSQLKVMKLKVFIERENKRVSLDIKKGATISDVLRKLKLNPVTVVTTMNNEVVTEGFTIQSEGILSIHSVVSGG